MINKWTVSALLWVFAGLAHGGECKQFVELYSAEALAKDYGTSEAWIVANHKVNLWEKPTNAGKGKMIGQMLPGSRALLLEDGEDYKVQSPLDMSIG